MKNFNVLIIGAGRIGAFFDTPKSSAVLSHAHAFSAHKGFKLVGFVDADFGAAAKAVKRWGGKAFKRLEDAFAGQKIDVVINATPDERHYEVLRQILDFPIKLIFAEKPLTKTAREAQEIIQLAKRKKVTLLANYSRRFVPEFQKLAADIRGGRFGRYLTGTGYYGKGTKHNGSHMVDCLRFLVGDVRRASVINQEYDFTPDDPAVSAVLELANRKPFFLQHVNRKLFTIFEMDLLFETGRIRVFDSGFKIEFQKIRRSKIYPDYRVMESAEVKKTSLDKALYFAANDIYRYLAANGRAVPWFDNGYQTLVTAARLVKNKL